MWPGKKKRRKKKKGGNLYAERQTQQKLATRKWHHLNLNLAADANH